MNENQGTIETQEEFEKSPEEFVSNWLEAIEIQKSKIEDWRKDCEEAQDVYEAKEAQIGTTYNLYHSNINTIIPAVYNSKPLPDVRNRFGDRNEPAKKASQLIERVISQNVDDTDWNEDIQAAVFEFVMDSQGFARVVYNPIVGDEIEYQECRLEFVSNDDYVIGPGRTWDRVSWVAFKRYLKKEQIRELNSEAAEGMEYSKSIRDEPSDEEGDIFKRAEVWEIWDKENRRIIFLSEGWDRPLEVSDDILGLEGFFPFPKPLLGTHKPGTIQPICDYSIYKPLLDELDAVTVRISRLVEGLRVRGIFGGMADSDIGRLLEADDNEYIEAGNIAAILDQGGLEKAIHYFPFDPSVKALQVLYAQRESIKQDIYEVTGLSDIMRGSSNPNETLGAQQIKADFGTMRIDKRKREVQRWIRDLFRIKAEIIAKHYEPRIIAALVGVELTEEVVQIFKNDLLRNYMVDVETDSTVQGDQGYRQQQMAAFVNATAQYWAAIAKPLDSGQMTPQAASQIYTSFARTFELGKEAEDALDSMVEDNNPERMMQQVQQQMQQLEQQKEQMEAELQEKSAMAEQKLSLKDEKTRLKADQASIDIKAKQLKIATEELEKLQSEMEENRKLDLEEKKVENDIEVRTQEAFRNYLAGDKASEVDAKGPMDAVMGAFDQMAQAIAGLAEAQQATLQGLEEIKEYIAAPAVVERDENGRVVGATKQIEPRTIQ